MARMRGKLLRSWRRWRAVIVGMTTGAVIGWCMVSIFAVEFRRAEPNLDDVFAASCRVSVSGARGSGTFVGVADDSPNVARILTNYHVVGRSTTATVDFWTNGVKQSIEGRVSQRAYDANMPADFAIITVDAQQLKQIVDPPFVALGGSDAVPGVDAFFLSCGGPKGWAVKAWKGKTLGYYNGATTLFQPHPVPGQSGSGLFEVLDGELFQTGIITWIIGQEGDDRAQGGAIPIANLYRAFQGGTVAEPLNGSPIPPGARECASRSFVYFRRDNCVGCDRVAVDVARLDVLAPTEVVDVETKEGYERAVALDVKEVPTLVVLEGETVVARVDYGEMSKTSLFQEASKALETKIEETVEPVEVPAETPAETSPIVPEWQIGPPNFTERPAVREFTAENISLLEDSERRWRERGQSRGLIEPEETPDVEEAPKLSDSALLEGLSDKLGGVIEERLTEGLESQIDKLESELKKVARRNLFSACVVLLALFVAARLLSSAGMWGLEALWDKLKGLRKVIALALIGAASSTIENLDEEDEPSAVAVKTKGKSKK